VKFLATPTAHRADNFGGIQSLGNHLLLARREITFVSEVDLAAHLGNCVLAIVIFVPIGVTLGLLGLVGAILFVLFAEEKLVDPTLDPTDIFFKIVCNHFAPGRIVEHVSM
jgi:hypothetical protein